MPVKNRVTRTLVMAALVAIPASTLSGQTAPDVVAKRFLEAVAARQWDQAARFLDQKAFGTLLESFVARTGRGDGRPPLPTVEDLRRRDPSMPREVAEWQVRQFRDAERQYADPTPFEFAGVRSVNELRRLSPNDAAARWLEARDPRYAIRRQLEAMQCPASSIDEIPVPERRVIGAVPDGPTTAFAVYREEVQFGGNEPSAGGDVGVIELHRDRDGWTIVPRGDLLPELTLDLDRGECPRG